MFSLLPKEEKFSNYLTRLSSFASTSAHLLKKYVESEDGRRAAFVSEIGHCKAGSKTLISHLTGELCRSFITPFDREDIQNFAQYLYRIPKTIEKVVQRMQLHGLTGGKEDFIRQINLIVDEAAAMESMVADLLHKRKLKHVTEKVVLLHELEQQGDDVLQELLGGLFIKDRDIKDLILRKDIYDMLEKVIDCYRDAAAVTLQIVLKYS